MLANTIRHTVIEQEPINDNPIILGSNVDVKRVAINIAITQITTIEHIRQQILELEVEDESQISIVVERELVAEEDTEE